MYRSFGISLGSLAAASLYFAIGAYGQLSSSAAVAAPASFPSVRSVQIVSAQNSVEIEVESGGHLVPQAQALTGPDRLVVDFPNAIPGVQLRSRTVNHGAVKAMRVGLFSANPPVTRLVFDLTAAQPYQIFSTGHSVILKLGGPAPDAIAEGVDDFPPDAAATRPGLVNTNFSGRPLPLLNTGATSATRAVEQPSAKATPQEPKRPPLEVLFNDGQLTIHSNKISLSEILDLVHQRTGADIVVPAGADREQVAADVGPGPTAEVLAHLLNGSKFNFLILNSASDSRVVDRVILSPRGEGSLVEAAATPVAAAADDDDPPTQAAAAEAPVGVPPTREPGTPPEQDNEPND